MRDAGDIEHVLQMLASPEAKQRVRAEARRLGGDLIAAARASAL
ncbi:MAG TPA: hypothetical protein VF407_19325 [Polyangiaceae bacterium]